MSGRRASAEPDVSPYARRPSIEYTVGSGEDGWHRSGGESKESNIEAWSPPRSAREAVPFIVSDGTEEEYAALHVKPAPARKRSPRKSRTAIERGIEQKVNQLTIQTSKKGRAAVSIKQGVGSPQESQPQLQRKGDHVSKLDRVGAAQSNGPGHSGGRKRPSTAKQKSQVERQIASNRKQPPAKARKQPPSKVSVQNSIRDDISEASDQTSRPPHVPGRRVEVGQRMRMKSAHGVSGLQSRQRFNVQTRIDELDERSRTRWSISARLEYEERLTQGIHVVPRSDKIDWFQDKIHRDDGTETRRAEEKATEMRLRRARCSLSCATLFKESERTKFIAGRRNTEKTRTTTNKL